jgi:hypothetical protein
MSICIILFKTYFVFASTGGSKRHTYTHRARDGEACEQHAGQRRCEARAKA